MTEVGDLLLLQQTDAEIAAASARMAEVEARLLRSEELEAAQDRLDAALAVEAEVAQSQRRLEAAIDDVNAKIAPDEKRLYDGTVKNPKELTAIGREVQHLKDRRSSLEDELLQLLERGDGAAATVSAARAAHAEALAQRTAEVASLTKQRDQLAGRLAELSALRETQRAELAGPTLVQYDRLLERKAGLAVASVRDGACQGCRVALPEAIRRRAATSPGPVQCPNCERVLSVGG